MKAYKAFNPDMTCRGFNMRLVRRMKSKESLLCALVDSMRV